MLDREEFLEIRRAATSLAKRRPYTSLDPDDLTQEVLMKLLDREDEDRLAYLNRVVQQVATDMIKADARRYEAEQRLKEQQWAPQADPSNLANLRLDLERALDRLPQRQRQVAVLYGMYGWSQDGVALRLGTAQGTVSEHWRAARDALAGYLENWRDFVR